MIGLGFYNVTQTTTDLNGPFLRFTSEPESSTVNDGGSVTFTGIATAEFKHNPTIPGERVTNTGTIGYQWYIDGVAAVDTTDKISGAQTNELTLSNLVSPTDNAKSVFLRAVYNGSAYQSESGAITAGIAASTGNGVNQPVDTSTIAVGVNPTITIDTQPEDATAGQGIDATFTVVVSTSDDSDVSYQWNQNGSPLSNSDSISGVNTPTLTISDFDVGTSSITVTVSHPTAGNSPVTSDAATFTVVANRSIIEWYYHNGNGDFFGNGTSNLADGSLTLTVDPSKPTSVYSFHTPEKDTKVKMTLAAAAGANTVARGGEGAKTEFNITLERNTEYILKLGSQSQPTGGLNGGGGAAYLYKKGTLLVACGGGGGGGKGSNANTNCVGGDGGGPGIAGFNGRNNRGGDGGTGGIPGLTGGLPTIGFFPGGNVYGGVNWDANTGGRVSGCTIGSDYFQARFSPCEDIGLSRFLDIRGNPISQTPIIQRGYKPGIGHRNNGGNGGNPNQAGGGSGAYGGTAGNDGSGGGGGSGYSNGEVEIITNGLGGNQSTEAFAIFELFRGDPEIRTVRFRILRFTDNDVTVTFTKTSGIGPDTLTFGPLGGTDTAQIGEGAVYERTSNTASIPQAGGEIKANNFRVVNNQSFEIVDQVSSDFKHLQITPDLGFFTDSTYKLFSGENTRNSEFFEEN